MGQANYDLPDSKIEKIKKLAKVKTKREALIIAIDEYLKKKEIEELIESYGKVSLSWTQQTLKKFRGKS